MRTPIDIAVAGAGIAGLAAAAFLARAGHRVTVFDRLAAPAPVGSGLIIQPVGMAALGALDAADAVLRRSSPIARLFGRVGPSGRIVLDVRYGALNRDVTGLGVHRADLFDALHGAAIAAGAVIVSGRTVCGAKRLGVYRMLEFEGHGEAGPFDLVVDALGARSPLSKPGRTLPYGALWANVEHREGFAEDALEQRYEAARRMVGVMPIGRARPDGPLRLAFFWSLREDAYARWRAAPLEVWREEVLRLWPDTAPLLDQIATHDELTFARYAHRTAPAATEPSLAHVGDAWHCTSPQLGQGANFALLDALALARALERSATLDRALHDYARRRGFHVRLYQAASFLFTPAYQSDRAVLPFIRDRIAGPLSRLWPGPPALAALVAGMWGAPVHAIARK
ncbi:MAG: FAD-dependent monooxygenase [Hydrogenophilaceae bacterium]|nr:FAD-dependent monooxygenase [Hydrogenophilaceae bacterium]